MAGRERKILMPSTSRKPTSITSSAGAAGAMCHQIAGLYDLEETLGKGHFAVVKAAKHVFTGERVAVKVIDKTKLDKMSQKALLQEVICMKLVQHANIIRLYEVIDTSTKMYLVLELGHGDLYDLILKQTGGLGEDVSRRYFSQIVSAVSYCHKLHVVHRDLKPENIVYFPNSNGGLVKLTDFGFSNRFHPGIKLDTSCGSLAYSAPEILLGDSYDAPAVDIWSLGIILYMLVCGRVPFQEANDSETLTMIMDVKYSIPSHVSIPCHHLISSMLVRFPERRANLDEIQSNPWLNQDDYMEKQIQTPLITDYHLTMDEKNTIVQQMVAGQIGTREEILEAVDKNAYNHVTSTFYLLAEKHVKENGLELGNERQPSGINSTLTSSLESLHDRRKNSSGHSGPSDTDDLEEDTLGPLDLEMKNASSATAAAVKKTYRLHTTHSSSALSDLDTPLPILEEDTAHSEEEDNAGPLLSQRLIHHRRQPYNHRRVMIPQRSTSCSSSEDEDSEKKHKHLKHKHLTKQPRSAAAECSQGFVEIKRFFDDESSDEQQPTAGTSATTCGGGAGTGSGGPVHQENRQSSGSGSAGDPAPICHVNIIPVDSEPVEMCRNESLNQRYLSLSKSNDYLSDTTRGFQEGAAPEPHSALSSSFNLAKKGKKLFLNWFFFKKGGGGGKKDKEREVAAEMPGSSRIYKTKSCSELKVKIARQGLGSPPPAVVTRDVNQNL